MFDPIWEAIARLERIGFFVLELCCDGASPNTILGKLQSKEFVYRVPNVFACDGEKLLYLFRILHTLRPYRTVGDKTDHPVKPMNIQ